jgi:hypothetical protein
MFVFGDSFDCYAVPADAITGYWDSGGPGNFTISPLGRFTGGQCVRNAATGIFLVKSSGANDAIHHIVCAFQQLTAALSGTTLGMYLQLSDGATNQVCIVFRSDGAILLTSATPVGTVLATYTGAVTLVSQWFAYEFEVVIHPTAGRFRVRKNNSTADDFDSGAVLNTRPGTNSYANKLTLGQNATVANHLIDDLLWRSDASSVPFVGDIRTYVRMPVSDASVVFSRSPTGTVQTPIVSNGPVTPSAAFSYYTPFVAAFDGTVGAGSVSINAGYTGNLKCSVFNSTGTAPSTVLASATTLVNPTTGANTITFPAPFAVTKGTQYWIGFATDTAAASALNAHSANGRTSSTTGYTAFPAASPTTSAGTGVICSWTLTPSSNTTLVNEAQQDSATSYVYSSNVGDTDLYNIASIAVTPASTVAVTTRAFVSKSDAGSRSGKVLLKSGGTTVDTGGATLATTWQQMWRTDTVDPATGAAWTPTGVNAVNVGFQVTA